MAGAQHFLQGFDFEAAIREELEKRQQEAVMAAFRQAWQNWQTLDQLAEVLNHPSIKPYLGKISRTDFEATPEHHRRPRSPNRQRPSMDVLMGIADSVLAQARKAPENGTSKNVLLGATGDKRDMAEAWWPEIKRLLGDRLEVIGHGRGVAFKAASNDNQQH